MRGITAAGTMPTDLERAGDFSQTRAANGQVIAVYDPLTSRPDPNNPGAFLRSVFPGNVMPANRVDPVSKAILPWIPHGNVPGAPLTNLNNFISNASSPVHKNGFTTRVDHSIRQNQKVFARFSLNNTPVIRPEIYGHDLYTSEPINGAVDQLNQRQATVNYSSSDPSDAGAGAEFELLALLHPTGWAGQQLRPGAVGISRLLPATAARNGALFPGHQHHEPWRGDTGSGRRRRPRGQLPVIARFLRKLP